MIFRESWGWVGGIRKDGVYEEKFGELIWVGNKVILVEFLLVYSCFYLFGLRWDFKLFYVFSFLLFNYLRDFIISLMFGLCLKIFRVKLVKLFFFILGVIWV